MQKHYYTIQLSKLSLLDRAFVFIKACLDKKAPPYTIISYCYYSNQLEYRLFFTDTCGFHTKFNTLNIVSKSHRGNCHALCDLFHAYFGAWVSASLRPTIYNLFGNISKIHIHKFHVLTSTHYFLRQTKIVVSWARRSKSRDSSGVKKYHSRRIYHLSKIIRYLFCNMVFTK